MMGSWAVDMEDVCSDFVLIFMMIYISMFDDHDDLTWVSVDKLRTSSLNMIYEMFSDV